MSTLRLLAGRKSPNETSKAVLACNDYLRLGSGRSLKRLQKAYLERVRSDGRTSVPSVRLPTLEKWSRLYGWQERADAYDAMQEEKRNRRAERILNSGLALPHRRVQALKEVAEKLIAEFRAGKLWLDDVKVVGSETITVKRYNSKLVEDIRGVFDDLAKETGGRRGNVENGQNRGLASFFAEFFDELREAGLEGAEPPTGDGAGDTSEWPPLLPPAVPD